MSNLRLTLFEPNSRRSRGQRNTAILMNKTKIGFVGKVEDQNGRGAVDLHIYDGGYVYSKDIVAYDATRRSDLHIVPTSRFSRDGSTASEGSEVFSLEIDDGNFSPELFVKELWNSKFEGFKSILEIDEMFLR